MCISTAIYVPIWWMSTETIEIDFTCRLRDFTSRLSYTNQGTSGEKLNFSHENGCSKDPNLDMDTWQSYYIYNGHKPVILVCTSFFLGWLTRKEEEEGSANQGVKFPIRLMFHSIQMLFKFNESKQGNNKCIKAKPSKTS